ncbi:Ca-activated chloride channel family protein [Chitinophaga costaii]|uniref:Ca-activated chloride channel family protein n=1 Tax=Chitinophaga costaii TaxID=1335309 RepID=A0A1C4DWD8_9BACT|nr:VWA domain-containing protein [Chitinophaga costaii]PUZ27836.1 VWA domain-containing protein [Chitinophaga costaii]SCC35667.1 Ca-activated chloride channel family protein [Chitinophaga costaii]
MDFSIWKNIEFGFPEFFWWLLLIPFMIFWYVKKQRSKQGVMSISSLQGLKNLPVSWKVRFRPLLLVLRILAFAALVVALARPQTSNTSENIDSEGIDIVLSLDISGSMLAQDLQPNRIEAAKKVAIDFVDRRISDRIGLVIFSGESFTQCPITTDHAVLKTQIAQVKSGMLQDGTAIGMGLATSVDRLRSSKAKSKVIILLTDGVNNTGLIDPLTALDIAKAFKVRVYTIGLGTIGKAPFPVTGPDGTVQMVMQDVQIDEALMKKIAAETGGKYYRATNNTSLQDIYDTIDKLEKTKVEITSYKRYAEHFFPFAMLALVCLLLEVVLRYTVFKSLP